MNVNANDNIVCSICIPNFNGARVVKACLDSVLAQDFPHPIEIIMHDDASTDDSADMVQDQYPDVRLIKSDVNVGFCISNNRMVKEAKGKYILLLNNDAILHKDSLSALYGYSIRKKLYGIIGLPQYCMESGELVDMGSLLDPFLNPVNNRSDSLMDVGLVIGACMWFPKKLWDELGGFPEWFGSIGEDLYLCCLARLKGYPVRSLITSGFDHWIGQSFGGGKIVQGSLRTTYARRSRSERNKCRVMVLCYPAPMAQVLIPIHLMFLAAEGLLLWGIKGEGRIWREIYLPCFVDMWQNRRRLMKSRRKIQAGRRCSLKSYYSVHTLFPYKLAMLVRYGIPELK
jgi:GT2 family glycosyltransferase